MSKGQPAIVAFHLRIWTVWSWITTDEFRVPYFQKVQKIGLIYIVKGLGGRWCNSPAEKIRWHKSVKKWKMKKWKKNENFAGSLGDIREIKMMHCNERLTYLNCKPFLIPALFLFWINTIFCICKHQKLNLILDAGIQF